MSKDLSRSFHRAFEERQISDYGEMLEPDELTARELIEEADFFISAIEEYIKVKFYSE